MEKGTEIDLWYGIDSGCSVRVQGKYVGPNKDGIPHSSDRIDAEVTDPDHLDMIGWESEDGPRIISARRLDETNWVSYDDFGWSPKGEIDESELVCGELQSKPQKSNDNIDQMKYINTMMQYRNLFR